MKPLVGSEFYASSLTHFTATLQKAYNTLCHWRKKNTNWHQSFQTHYTSVQSCGLKMENLFSAGLLTGHGSCNPAFAVVTLVSWTLLRKFLYIHSGAGKGNIPADSCLLVLSLLHLQSLWLLLSSLAAGCLLYLNSCLRAERGFQACSLVGSPDCTITFTTIPPLSRPAAKGKKAPNKYRELCLLYPNISFWLSQGCF